MQSTICRIGLWVFFDISDDETCQTFFVASILVIVNNFYKTFRQINLLDIQLKIKAYIQNNTLMIIKLIHSGTQFKVFLLNMTPYAVTHINKKNSYTLNKILNFKKSI